ncbi:MAG TPA: hypothetical protein VGM81_22460 [Burkholderiaceae bacterium]|jgi:hypothetical protein
MSTTASVSGSQQVTYTDTATGNQTTLSGGSAAWRNNNPGNIVAGPVATQLGAIGKDSNGFAIFSNVEIGTQALAAVVQTYVNAGSSIDSMMQSYAPSFQNNTAAYQKFLSQQVGVSGATKLKNLTPTQTKALLSGIVRFEGTTPGKAIYNYPHSSIPVTATLPDDYLYTGSYSPSKISMTITNPVVINPTSPPTQADPNPNIYGTGGEDWGGGDGSGEDDFSSWIGTPSSERGQPNADLSLKRIGDFGQITSLGTSHSLAGATVNHGADSPSTNFLNGNALIHAMAAFGSSAGNHSILPMEHEHLSHFPVLAR